MLKNIAVKGELYCEYAYLTYDMCFVNDNPHGVLAEYVFSLPQGAVISDMKIRRADNSTVNTTVVSVSHAERMWDASFAGAALSRIDNTTYMLRFGDAQTGESHIRLRLYVGMESSGTEKTLTLPLARESRGSEKCERYANILLVLHGDFKEVMKYFSPTHEINVEVMERNAVISTGDIRADRDFSIRISGEENKNSAIVVYNQTGGNMLCRLYPTEEFCAKICQKYNKILLVYESSGSLLYGASSAGRELLLALAKNFDGKFMAISSGNSPEMLTSGFCENTEENIFILTRRLSESASEAGSLSALLRCAKKYITEDTLPVLICGASVDLQTDELKEELSGSGFCAVTLGATVAGEELNEFINSCGGVREHIFGNDNIAEKAEEILRKFVGCRAAKTEVYANGERAAIINGESGSGRGITVFADFSGEAIPRRFLIKCQDIEQEVLIDNISVYQSFAPIQLAYAEFVSKCIEKRLELCDANEVQALRSKLEETGIKYSYINSETAFVAMADGNISTVIRTIVPDSGIKAYEVFGGRPSAFGEIDTDMKPRELLTLCTDIIIRSVRADGAICAGGEVNQILRRQQTLVAVLALVASKAQDGAEAVILSARKYLGDFAYGDMKFTDNPEVAADMLCRFFGEEKTISYGFVPDLMTAARMIAQNHKK